MGKDDVQQDGRNPIALPVTPSSTQQPSARVLIGVNQASAIQKPSLAKRLFWGFAFLFTAGVSATVGMILTLMTPLPSAIAPSTQDQPNVGQNVSLSDIWRNGLGYHITRPVNVLVMGIDRVPGVTAASKAVFGGRSDTMLLVRIDPANESLNVLSIPRDTRVDIPGVGINKINHANFAGGAELAAQAVSHNMDGVEIDRYVRVSTEAFRELVDLLGGVTVFVPYRMYYVDNTQKLHIDLQPGEQTLNGQQAEGFARFRHDAYGDVGRVQRQQQLIRALRERVMSPTVLPKIPEAMQILQRNLDTNLSLDEMLALITFGLNLDQDHFRMVMLPGRFSSPDEYIASYWIMDRDGRDQIMQNYFGLSSVVGVSAPQDVNTLRIAVQNASGNPSLGREVASYLRDRGFRNVYVIRDSPEEQRETQIIAQRGDLEGAAVVETALGIGQVVPASIGDLDSDLTIRVGSDWVGQPELTSPNL
jgi:polyisoprenyl-teichoic acid--peptidoglycan teichoic acid transferase